MTNNRAVRLTQIVSLQEILEQGGLWKQINKSWNCESQKLEIKIKNKVNYGIEVMNIENEKIKKQFIIKSNNC